MTRKEEILKYLNRNDLTDCLNKYKDPKDLLIILVISLENKWFNSATEVIECLPKTEEYDLIKCDLLRKYINELLGMNLCRIIMSIINDDTKLKLMNEYYIAHSSDIEISWHKYAISRIINSLNNDNLRKKKFREYIDLYDSEDFSDYLRNIKDDSIRTSEFEFFKVMYPKYRLDWIAAAYSNDEKRINAFNRYLDDSKKHLIPHFISELESDKVKLECLGSYYNLIHKSDVEEILNSINDQDVLCELLKRYRDKIGEYEIHCTLFRIKNENKRIEMLDEVSQYVSPSVIVSIINGIKNYEKKLEVFDKYLPIMKDSELRDMLIHIDDNKQEEFLDKYIKYYNGNIITNVWFDYRFGDLFVRVNRDIILNKYMDLFSKNNILDIINYYTSKNYDLASIIFYLLGKTSNPNVIKNIYEAGKLIKSVTDIESKEKVKSHS